MEEENSSENMAESNDSFQTYHLTKFQRRVKKPTIKTRRGAIGKAFPGLRPFGSGFRYPTLLEQKLLPMMIKGDDAVVALPNDKSKGEQLTIFYDGVINVYDNVSVDKAKAIMLLAGETSASAPVVKNVQGLDASKIPRKQFHHQFASYNQIFQLLQSILWRFFFNKRRDRLMKKIPLVPTSHVQTEDDSQAQEK